MLSNLALNSLALIISSGSVLAQFQGTTYNQTGPFLLRVVSANDDTLEGTYLTTCRAGASTESLCIGPNEVNNFTLSFFYNYTIINGQPSKTGFLTWSLPVSGAEGPMSVSEPMSLSFQPGSNVAVPMFRFDEAGTPVGWNNDTLFIASPYDDSKFRPNVYPNATTTDGSIMQQLSNWHSCWVLYSAYYFNSVGWVSGGEPRNPTCEPVTIVRVDPTSLVVPSASDELPDEDSQGSPGEGQDDEDREADDDDDEDASAEGQQTPEPVPEGPQDGSAEKSASGSAEESQDEHDFIGAVQDTPSESLEEQSQQEAQGEQAQESEQSLEGVQMDEKPQEEVHEEDLHADDEHVVDMHAEEEHAEEEHEGDEHEGEE